jgi:hypothetical protein
MLQWGRQRSAPLVWVTLRSPAPHRLCCYDAGAKLAPMQLSDHPSISGPRSRCFGDLDLRIINQWPRRGHHVSQGQDGRGSPTAWCLIPRPLQRRHSATVPESSNNNNACMHAPQLSACQRSRCAVRMDTWCACADCWLQSVRAVRRLEPSNWMTVICKQPPAQTLGTQLQSAPRHAFHPSASHGGLLRP